MGHRPNPGPPAPVLSLLFSLKKQILPTFNFSAMEERRHKLEIIGLHHLYVEVTFPLPKFRPDLRSRLC